MPSLPAFQVPTRCEHLSVSDLWLRASAAVTLFSVVPLKVALCPIIAN